MGRRADTQVMGLSAGPVFCLVVAASTAAGVPGYEAPGPLLASQLPCRLPSTSMRHASPGGLTSGGYPSRITTMTLNETLEQLEALGNEKVRAQNAKSGARNNQFGVRHGDIRTLAKKIRTD